MQTTVQSLDELARQSRINYTTVSDSPYFEYFKNMAGAEEELYRKWKEITLNSSSDESKYRVWDYPVREQYTHILKVRSVLLRISETIQTLKPTYWQKLRVTCKLLRCFSETWELLSQFMDFEMTELLRHFRDNSLILWCTVAELLNILLWCLSYWVKQLSLLSQLLIHWAFYWDNLSHIGNSEASLVCLLSYRAFLLSQFILQVINQTGTIESPEEGFKKVEESTKGQFAFIYDAAEIKYQFYKNCNFIEVGEAFAEQPLVRFICQKSVWYSIQFYFVS